MNLQSPEFLYGIIFISLLLVLTIINIRYSSHNKEVRLDLSEYNVSNDRLAKHIKNIASSHQIYYKKRCSSKVFKNTRKCMRELKEYYTFLSNIPDKGIDLVPSAQWVIDNYYVISRENKLIRQSFSKKFYRHLPCLKGEKFNKYPRVYMLAVEILKATQFHLDEDMLIHLLNIYQQEEELTVGEIWALQNVLKVCLIQYVHNFSSQIVRSVKTKQRADELINAILRRGISDEKEILKILISGSNGDLLKDTGYMSQLLHRIDELETNENAVKSRLCQVLKCKEEELSHFFTQEVHAQAELQVRISSTLTSLIEMAAIDWEQLFENTSLTEKALMNDPAGVYSQMTFVTRDFYQHKIEAFAKRFSVAEREIAVKLVELSERVGEKNSPEAHVGYYLLGKGVSQLEKAFEYEVRGFSKQLRWLDEHKGFYYIFGMSVLVLLSMVGIIFYGNINTIRENPIATLVLYISSLILAITIAHEVTNYLITTFIKPTKMLEMDFAKGIPRDISTMVVMPVIISSVQQAESYFKRIEAYYMANKHKQLFYAILSDFKDSDEEETEQDKEIVEYAKKRTRELNRVYSDYNEQIFFYFQRRRKFNEHENCFMGWERKRGKLEEFNRLLQGAQETDYSIIEGNTSIFPEIKYIITIDADTQLTKDSALRLIGIMAHPLNRPVIDEEKGRVIDGYGLIQPRVGIRIGDAMQSMFSRIFAGQAGIDPYQYAVSDLYQDVFKEGTFTGKGIYDVKVFNRVMDNRLPENSVLSHDLLEGSYVRCGLATDIRLMDGYPSTVFSFFKREHRWIRGDWQLLPWLLGRDRLGLLSRWKISENLRRSTIPFMQLITIILGAILGWNSYLTITIAMGGILFSLLVNVIHTTLFWIKNCTSTGYISKGINYTLLVIEQGLFVMLLIPYKAVITVDAIIRTLFRMYVSHKKLLEWQTAEAVEKNARNTLLSYIRQMWQGPVVAIILFLLTLNKPGAWVYYIIALLWTMSPIVSWITSIPMRQEARGIKRTNEEEIRRLARKTWRYFEEFFYEKDNWLTPDNYQVFPTPVAAHRTSPTNIGLQLLATITARDMGYIGLYEFVKRLEKTFETIERLEKWNGHLFNWYDTRTLEVLEPRYVSTVDSGNYAGYLIVIKNMLVSLKEKKIFANEQLDGLITTAKLAEVKIEAIKQFLLDDVIDILFTERDMYIESIKNSSNTAKEWRTLLLKQSNEFRKDIMNLFQHNEHNIESVMELNNNEDIMSSRNQVSINNTLLRTDVTLLELVQDNSKNAVELIERIERLVHKANQWIEEMNFKPLYDYRRNLFRIGYNISLSNADSSYYDLLASEARLASFLAIAKGDIPQKHWFKLGRPMTIVHGKATLLSWSGTMFEYLMPNLVMNCHKSTVLGQSLTAVVKKQISYASKKRVPWGISESGYYRFDQCLNYQYRAFGVPALGLRSDIKKSLVISPYSSLLALEFAEELVCDNIHKLKKLKAEGKYGFYEALDYLTPAVENPGSFETVQSFMIHHQGMILVSINNYLNKNIMQKRFHCEPMVKGTELILEEIQPFGIIVENEEKIKGQVKSTQFIRKVKEDRVVRTTRTRYPVAGILSNGSYNIMLTSNGCGLSSFGEMAINRWRQVMNENGYGMFVYVRDIRRKKYWSAGYMPTGVDPSYYTVSFSPDKVQFERKDGSVETRMEVTVSPSDPVEIRRVYISNKGMEIVNIDVTSYFEPIIDNYRNDLAHPAFNKLFVSTEYVDEQETLIATRRPRKEKEQRKYVFHTAIIKGKMLGNVEYETDRSKFIGRGKTLRHPETMTSEIPLSNTTGYVLDPVMSMRGSVTLLPGRTAVVTFVVGAASSRENALEISQKYKSMHAIEDAFKMAWFNSKVEMQYLGLSMRQVNAIQDLTGSLYYPSRLLRGPVDVIGKNTMKQSDLWKFGISGDHPIILYRINDIKQIDELKNVVLAYEYMRKNGIRPDLVILNEEEASYLQTLNQKIEEVISGRRIYYPNSGTPNVYILKSKQMSQEEINLLLAVARIVVTPKNRIFSRRTKKLLMEEKQEIIAENEFQKACEITKESNERIEEELLYFNGFGGFSKDGSEYVIKLTEQLNTPVPWSNIIANKDFGFMITSSGSGYTWYKNSRENKLTSWSNDPISDPPSECIYIKDTETGGFYTPTPLPVREDGEYIIRHGFGYSEFLHTAHQVKQKLTVLAALNEPVKIYLLELNNIDKKQKVLDIYFYVEWVLGVNREDTSPHIFTEYYEKERIITAQNKYNMEFSEQIAFIATNADIESYTADRSEFIGRTGDMKNPFGLHKDKLLPVKGAALEPCGVFQVKVRIEPQEHTKLVFIMGEADNMDRINEMASSLNKIELVEGELIKVKEHWSEFLGQIKVETPETSLDLILNGWLLYQVYCCRMLSRSAFYQSGGAFGFRDQLQDSLALKDTKPQILRQQIIKHCSRQFIEGDVQHWWHDDSGKGVRTKISDDLLWLPFATAIYIKSTGDASILDEEVLFLETEPLGATEDERYTIPKVSTEKASVYEHCIRAIERGSSFGEHGLPLIGAGDWNDGMNQVGSEGKGESVWLGWFLYKVLNDFIPVCQIKTDRIHARQYKERANTLLEHLEKNAWDGEWYLRAFFDDGTPMGSRNNTECRIDSISQTWSVISGGGSSDRIEKALDSLKKYLINDEEKIAMLLTPPFDKSMPQPGYIKGYLPGIRENGGQYSHAAIWNIIAFAIKGEGDYAGYLFNMINPINHSNNYSEAVKYKQEPYVMSADVYSVDPHTGRGGWSWYTGSAGWMYQAGIEHILGIKKVGSELKVNPSIPSHWEEYTVSYRFGQSMYQIHVMNPNRKSGGKVEIKVNGELYNESIPLNDDGGQYKAEVTIL